MDPRQNQSGLHSDRLGWDNYNESLGLADQIRSYKNRFGCYPASVHADNIYRNRTNIKFCKKHGIRLPGPSLGRPPKDAPKRAKIRKQTRQNEIDRIPIEGKFGQAKRRFSLSMIMSKLAETSETAIAVIFLVMNLEKWLKVMLIIFLFAFGGYAHPKTRKRWVFIRQSGADGWLSHSLVSLRLNEI